MEEDIKQKILKGAQALFMKYGVRSISMDDIARQLSVSKKTLYQHFEDKEDIVTMACQMHIEQVKNQFDNIKAISANAVDELARTTNCLKSTMEDLNPALLYDLKKYHPKAWAVWLDHKNRVIRESVVTNLLQGIEEGYFRPDIDVEVLANMRLEMMQIAFDDNVYPPRQYDLGHVQVQLFEHFVYGVVTEQGKQVYQSCKEKNLAEVNSINQR